MEDRDEQEILESPLVELMSKKEKMGVILKSLKQPVDEKYVLEIMS